MIDLMPAPVPVAAHTKPVDREGTTMLLHYEALARSRQQEAEQAAREFALARSFTAGRRWAVLARFAARRAERAFSASRTRGTVGGLRSAV